MLIKVLTPLSQNNYTQIFFVPANKINFYIKIFKRFYSGRKIVVAKEITKLHEASNIVECLAIKNQSRSRIR